MVLARFSQLSVVALALITTYRMCTPATASATKPPDPAKQVIQKNEKCVEVPDCAYARRTLSHTTPPTPEGPHAATPATPRATNSTIASVQWSFDDDAGPPPSSGRQDDEAGRDGGAHRPSGEADTLLSRGPACAGLGYEFLGEGTRSGTVQLPLSGSDTLDCQAACEQRPESCQAWSWVDPERAISRSDLGTCYFHHFEDDNVPRMTFVDNGIWSGSRGCISRNSSVIPPSLFRGWQCPGRGYQFHGKNFLTLGAASAHACKSLCNDHFAKWCVAWSWSSENDVCSLKNGVPRLLYRRGFFAGTRLCLLPPPASPPPPAMF